VCIPPLVGELRSHRPSSQKKTKHKTEKMGKKKKKKKKNVLNLEHRFSVEASKKKIEWLYKKLIIHLKSSL
jgi:hypothetical protein